MIPLKLLHVHGHRVEDPTHFFLNYHRYAAIRIELTTAVLLYGKTDLSIDENKHIFDEEHKFITLSRRFE